MKSDRILFIIEPNGAAHSVTVIPDSQVITAEKECNSCVRERQAVATLSRDAAVYIIFSKLECI